MREPRRIAIGIALVVVGLGAGLLPTLPLGGTTLLRNVEGIAFAGLMVIDLSLTYRMRSVEWGGWFALMVVGFVLSEFVGPSQGWPTSFTTLNETFLAMVLLSAVVRLTRSRPPQLTFVLLVAVIVVVTGELIGPLRQPGTWIIDHAETTAFTGITIMYLLLVAAVDPWHHRSSNGVTGWWLASLAAIPIGASLLNRHGVDSVAAIGVAETTLVWLQRVTEAFIGAFVITFVGLFGRSPERRSSSR